jgi:hypothetical protein
MLPKFFGGLTVLFPRFMNEVVIFKRFCPMVDSEHFLVLYLLLILGPLAALWIMSGWRDRRLRMPLAERWLYRCSECSRFYDSDEPVEKLHCPLCGRQNERLKI